MTNHRNPSRALALALLAPAVLAAHVALAAPRPFTIRQQGPVKPTLVVESTSDVENFAGRTDKVTGELTFDPVAKTGGGAITVDGASIDTGVPGRNEHMRGKQWMNFDEHPKIRFEATRVEHVADDRYRVTGKLTLSGATRELTTEASVRYAEAGEATRKAGFAGDVLYLRTSFKIKLADYGIRMSEKSLAKFADSWTVQLSAVASSGQ